MTLATQPLRTARLALLATVVGATTLAACASPTEPVAPGRRLAPHARFADVMSGTVDSAGADSTVKPHDQHVWW